MMLSVLTDSANYLNLLNVFIATVAQYCVFLEIQSKFFCCEIFWTFFGYAWGHFCILNIIIFFTGWIVDFFLLGMLEFMCY